ncbi:MAG: hypothetical protein ACXWQR_13890 [Ktedonobacterales bacterium]
MAENTIAAHMHEVVPVSEPPHTPTTRAARFKMWRGSRPASPPPVAPIPPDDEIALVRKSSQLLLAKLAELRQRIENCAPEPAVSTHSAAQRIVNVSSHVPV